MAFRIKFISKDTQTKILSALLSSLYRFKKHFFKCKNINFPKDMPVIVALWHEHQCGIYGFIKEGELAVMVSKSRDGDMIASASEALGLKPIRGSYARGGAGAALKFIETLNEGISAAITIDGPRGPRRVVKKGAIEIAKLSGRPIVPYVWYSDSIGMLKFNSWDKMRFPLTGIDTVGLYGDPIYVDKDANPEEIELIRQKVETELKLLYEKVKRDYKKLLKG